MNHIAQSSRRTFLKTTALASGGLLIGVAIPALHEAQAAGMLYTPNAWVHIADGQAWLPPDMDLLPNASYDLQLTESDLGAAEYVPNKTYLLHFSDGSIGGNLGSFAFREIGQVAPGTPLNVGPVAMTVPELPVSMVIQVQDQQFTEIETVTGSGHHYTFSAVPSAQ